jgi:catechol 1,2-dioxygenase
MIIRNQRDVTTAALAERERAPNTRFREIMAAAERHLRDFVREASFACSEIVTRA